MLEFISQLRHLCMDDMSVENSLMVIEVELSCLSTVIWYYLTHFEEHLRHLYAAVRYNGGAGVGFSASQEDSEEQAG